MVNIFYISKANSIPFVDRTINRYVTEYNALSFEGKQFLSQRAVWNLQPNDRPVIQIKSNLSNIKAKVYKNEILQEEIDAVLKVENINQNITLDCEVISLEESNNKGLKFTSGNVYDNFTDLNIIDTYNIYGNLPDFVLTDKDIIGKNIAIGNNTYEILSIIYDEFQDAWSIEINTTSLPNNNYAMSLNYNIEEFNVYEIPFNLEQYNNSELIILIQAENGITTFYKVSELLSIGFIENLIELQYADYGDKDIYYSTEISHLLRIPYTRITPYTIEDSENQLNDNSVYLIDTQINEGIEYFLEGISFKQYRQLVLALNSSRLFIDGIGYVIDGNINKEDNEDTNLLDISFKVLKSNEDLEISISQFKRMIVDSNNVVLNNTNIII